MTAPADPKKTEQTPARTKPWRRRLRRAAIILVASLLVLRIALAFLLPAVLRKTAGRYDLSFTCDRIDLSLMGGDAGIWNLQLTPRGHRPAGAPATAAATPDPLFKSEYVRARISPLALLIGRLHIHRVECDGAEMLLDRQADGRIPVLDRFVTGASPAAKPAAKPSQIDLASPLRMDALRVGHLRLHVRDRAVTPALDVEIGMELRVTDLGSRNRPARLEFTAQSDPLVNRLRIQIEGTGRQRNLDARIKAELQGLRPKPLAGYLAALGFSPDANEISGRLSVQVHAEPLAAPAAGVSAKVTLDSIDLTEDNRESFGLDHLVLDARSIDRTGADFSSLTIEGLRFHGSRTPAGLLRLAGLCLTQAAAAAASGSEPAPVAASAASPPAAAPAPTVGPAPAYRFSLQEFVLRRFVATFDDDAVSPPAHLEFDLDEVTSRNLTGKPSGPDTPITIACFGRAPGIARSLKLEGQVTPGSDKKTLALRLSVEGIKLDALQPYLTAAGLRSEYANGLLTADISGAFAAAAGSTAGEATIKSIRLQDGDREFLNIPSIRIAGLRMSPPPASPHLDVLEIAGPSLTAIRETDGSLGILGLRTVVRPAGEGEPSDAIAAKPSPAASEPAGVPAAAPKLSLPPMEIGRFTWKDVRLTLDDRATTPASRIEISEAGFTLSDLVIRPGAAEGRKAAFEAFLAAPGLAERVTVKGSLAPRSDALAADWTVHAEGLDTLALAPYLGRPGAQRVRHNGSFNAQFTATLASAPDGLRAGLAVRDARYEDGPQTAALAGLEALWVVHGGGGQNGQLTISGVDFRDSPPAPDTAPRFHFDRAAVVLSRVDPPRAIDIDSVELAGLTTSTTFDSSGPRPVPDLAPAPAPAPQPQTQPATSKNPSGYTLPPKFPAVQIRNVDLRASAITFRDAARPDAAALELRDVRLHNVEPIACLGKQSESQPPIRLQLTAAVAPVAEQLKIDVTASPFSLRNPHASIDLAVTGIQGAGLTALRPDLGDRIDGSLLRQGTLHAQLTVRARLDRRSPIDFALARPFEADVMLREVHFQSEPDGEVLLGFEELRADSARIDRGASRIDLKSVELTKPTARLARRADGIHALGLVLKMPAAATRPSEEHETQAAAVTAAAPGIPPEPSAAKSIARIQKFTISGVDVVFEDRTGEPALVVPLTGLEFEAHGLSSNIMADPKPFRYNLLLTAGKVPLAGRGAAEGTERELFAEISSSGRLALAPRPSGYLKASISGFELTSLRGLASQHGVTLENGLFDESLEARFRADGTGSLHTRTAITDLSISEPPKGPIAEFFKFPAPLDVAIAAIQAPDGSITLPVDVPLKDYRFGAGDVALPAVAAVTQAVAIGIASTPLKAAAGLLGGGSDTQRRLGTVTLAFAPGATVLDTSSAAALKVLSRRLQEDNRLAVEIRHDLAPGDLERASLRANPDRGQARSIVAALRRKRTDLLNIRVQVAGQFRAALAANPDAAANNALLQRLRLIDIEIAQTEEALDLASDLFRPGASRQADRRTRAGALQIARERLDLVRSALAAAEIQDLTARMVVATPQAKPVEGRPDGRIVINIVRRNK